MQKIPFTRLKMLEKIKRFVNIKTPYKFCGCLFKMLKMLILRPVCEILAPFKSFSSVLLLEIGRAKAAQDIWLTFVGLIIRKNYRGGASVAPPTQKESVYVTTCIGNLL